MTTNQKKYIAPTSEFGVHVLVPGVDPVVDIIAVHGLDGHLTKSWTAKNGTLWIGDLLPEVIPHARILTFGYVSRMRGQKQLESESIRDRAMDLLSSLATERSISGVERRPIIFIAHSLGGVILKSALLIANSSSRLHNPHHKAVELSTHGIIFLGTPHQGSDSIDLALILLHIQSTFSETNDVVVKDLRPHSEALREVLDSYVAIGHQYETKFCYELHATKLLAGKSIKLVDQCSAVVPGMKNAESVALKKDHVGIAKFSDRDDGDYKTVASHLLSITRTALLKIANKWDRYDRLEDLDKNIGNLNVLDHPVTQSNKVVNNPYKAMPLSSMNFIGRDEYLKRLRKYFGTRDEESKCRKVFVLHGTGGIGKSQIAIKFGEDSSDLFSRIFWIDATSVATIKFSLHELARDTDTKSYKVEESSPFVLRWLARNKENWLMIYDNADGDPQVVIDHLPGGNEGNIIITSKNPDLKRIGSPEGSLDVDDLNEGDAISLLLKSAFLDENSVENRAMAAPIVKELLCLPLAVDQAGATISSGQCDLSIYLERYSAQRNYLVDNYPSFKGASNYECAIYATFEISDKIIQSSAIEESYSIDSEAFTSATAILKVLGFLHHENVTEEMFKRAAESLEPSISSAEPTGLPPRSKRISQVFRRSIRGQNTKRFDTWSSNRKTAESSLDLILILLQLDTHGHWDEMPFKEGIRVLLSFSLIKRTTTENAYRIHPLVRNWSRDRLENDEPRTTLLAAISLLSRSITGKEFSSANHVLGRTLIPHIVSCQTNSGTGTTVFFNEEQCENFGSIFDANGFWSQAEYFHLQALAIRKRTLGVEHPETLTSSATLAMTYSQQGRWKEVEALQAEVAETSKRVLGEEHPDTLRSVLSLAKTYGSQGRWKKAGALQTEVMESRKRVLGEEHPDALAIIADLAETYSSRGKLKEAEALRVEVMETRKRVLGEDHPETLTSMANLALTYSREGRRTEAEALQAEVLESRKRVLGEDHPDTLAIVADLAVTYSSQGLFKEAEVLRAEVMETRKRLLGAEHPDTLAIVADLAAMYWNQRRWKEAESLQAHVMETRKWVLGEEHDDTLMCVLDLARTYQSQGRWKDAEALQTEVMETMKRVRGEEHPSTLKSLAILASTYWRQGRWKEAEELQIRVVDAETRIHGADHLGTLRSTHSLAHTLKSQGRDEEAVALMQDVVNLRVKRIGIKHPDTLLSIKALEKWNGAVAQLEDSQIKIKSRATKQR